MSAKRIGLYPGTFDPVTLGHIDIIKRAVKLVDHLVIGIANNPSKTQAFSIEERIAMLRGETAALAGDGLASITVETFDTLLIHFAKKIGARVIIRGLRAVSDFEYEFQMALMNRRLNHDLETVFLMPAEQFTYTSSRLIKEVFKLGGEVGGLVPSVVEERLRQKQATQRDRLAGARQI